MKLFLVICVVLVLVGKIQMEHVHGPNHKFDSHSDESDESNESIESRNDNIVELINIQPSYE